jgi:CHAT domain-containing protein
VTERSFSLRLANALAVCIGVLMASFAAPGAAAQESSDLWKRVSAASDRWRKSQDIASVGPRLQQLAPLAEKSMRRRLAANSKSGDDSAAWVFVEFFDALKDQKSSVVWRNLLLLRSAQVGGIVGDYESVAWFFQLLADAQYHSPKVYERALQFLDTTGESTCDKTKAQSVCELEIGGAALRAVGGVHTGLLLQEAALERLEQTGSRNHDHAARLRLSTAIGWWRDGVASRADQHLSQLTAQLAAGHGRLIPGDSAAYHALRGAVCEARLDFSCAEREVRASVAAFRKAKPRGNQLELFYRAADMLDALTIRVIARGRCLDCPQNLVEPVSRYALAIGIAPDGMMRRNRGLAATFLQAFPQTFTEAERGAILADRDGDISPPPANVKTWLARVKSRERRVLYRHLLRSWDLMTMMRVVPQNADATLAGFSAFVSARSVGDADRHVDAMLQALVENTYNFGGTRDFLSDLSEIAFLLRSGGAAAPEHSVLRYLWRFYQGNFVNVPNPIAASGKANLAAVLAPAFARLAELERKSGHIDASRTYLAEVQSLVGHKLDREWRFGEAQAVAAIRGLRSTIQGAAATLVAVSQRLSGAAAVAARREAFELAQVAALSDTAASLQLTLRDRDIAASGLGDQIKKRNSFITAIDVAEAVVSEYGGFSSIGARQHGAELAKSLAPIRQAIARKRGAGTVAGLDTQKPVPAAELAGHLSDGEELLAIQSTAQGSLVFLVDGTGQVKAHLNRYDNARALRAVQMLRKGLVLRKDGGYPVFPVRQAYKFFRAFFGPLAADIKSARAIVLVVSGPIEALPLSALPTADDGVVALDSASARQKKISWLVRTTAVSRAPSIRTLVVQRSAEGGGGAAGRLSTFAGVGDPTLAPVKVAGRATEFSGIVRRNQLADVEWLRGQASLPETRQELAALAAEFSESVLFLGGRAREGAIKAAKLTGYDVMAFATHGVVAGFAFDGSEPGLVLTPPAKASRRDDGFLTMSEIADLKLGAQLVILSACDTATSDGRPMADGLSGLARAFFLAGARNLIATHWAIPSQPAVEITTGTVRARMHGEAPDWSRALRQAQIALIDETGPNWFAHPTSWGAFQVIGAH